MCDCHSCIITMSMSSMQRECSYLRPPSGGRELGKDYSSHKRLAKYQYMPLHVSADESWRARANWAGLCTRNCVCLRVELHRNKRFPVCTFTIQRRKIKSRYGARNRFQEPSLELSSQAIRIGWRASTTTLCLLGS
jgi:hypothetical protein